MPPPRGAAPARERVPPRGAGCRSRNLLYRSVLLAVLVYDKGCGLVLACYLCMVFGSGVDDCEKCILHDWLFANIVCIM